MSGGTGQYPKQRGNPPQPAGQYLKGPFYRNRDHARVAMFHQAKVINLLKRGRG